MICRVEGLMQRFSRDEGGATAIEYALIVAIVAIGIVASLYTLRDSIVALVQQVIDGFAGT